MDSESDMTHITCRPKIWQLSDTVIPANAGIPRVGPKCFGPRLFIFETRRHGSGRFGGGSEHETLHKRPCQ